MSPNFVYHHTSNVLYVLRQNYFNINSYGTQVKKNTVEYKLSTKIAYLNLHGCTVDTYFSIHELHVHPCYNTNKSVRVCGAEEQTWRVYLKVKYVYSTIIYRNAHFLHCTTVEMSHEI